MRRQRGFTLLEATFAVAIVGGAFLVILRAVGALAETGRVADLQVTATAENFRGLSVLRDDLRMARRDSFVVGADGDWAAYRLVDGETLSSAGRVVPVLSPRIWVFLDGTKLLRAVVDDAAGLTPPLPPESVLEVRVLASDVARVEFGDPLAHDGAFTVLLTTLRGDPGSDRRVEVTNFLAVTSGNQRPIVGEGAPPTPPVPIVFVEGTRQAGAGAHLRAIFENVTAHPVVVNAIRVDWTPQAGDDDPAYYREIRIDNVVVWSSTTDPAGGGGRGETRVFNAVPGFEFAPGTQAEFWFKNSKMTRTGGGAAAHIGGGTPFTLTFLLDEEVVATVAVPPLEEEED